MWCKHGKSINCLFLPNMQCWWLTCGVAWGALGPGCLVGGLEQSQASAKWLRLWTQGSSLETKVAEKLTLPSGTSLFPQKNPIRNMPRGCVWAPVKDLPYSTTAKQRSVQSDNSQSFQVREEPSVSPFQEIFPWELRKKRRKKPVPSVLLWCESTSQPWRSGGHTV